MLMTHNDTARPGTPRIPVDVFKFSGQSHLDTWTLSDVVEAVGWSAYDAFLSHEPELCFERIRDLADAFPTYQRTAETGRPPIDERTHLIAMLVKQFTQSTYRELESLLRLLQDFFAIPHVPDATTMSRKNGTSRFQHLLKRFHAFVLEQLPSREVVVATDATGYSGQKSSWSRTDYGLRATQDWVKSHACVEIPTLLYLSTVQTPSNVHESQAFEAVWTGLPDGVSPVRSLADGAYQGNACLEVVRRSGATPLHDVRADARHVRWPRNAYEKLVNFATHWPNRYRALTRHRKLVETVFACTKEKFGERLRCRDPVARENEVLAKQLAHNIRMVVMREVLVSG